MLYTVYCLLPYVYELYCMQCTSQKLRRKLHSLASRVPKAEKNVSDLRLYLKNSLDPTQVSLRS